MENYFVDLYKNFYGFVVISHILSSMLYMGVCFTMIFLIKPVLKKIKIPRIAYGSGIELTRVFLIFSFIVLGLLVVTSLVMDFGASHKSGKPTIHVIIHTLEAIWSIIIAVNAYIYYKYLVAKKCFAKNEYIETHENLELIYAYSIPFNFVMSIVSIYFSIVIKGCRCWLE